MRLRHWAWRPLGWTFQAERRLFLGFPAHL
jgi:hypothetical protein